MDFFFEDLPSTSRSTPKKGPEDSQMGEDTVGDSSRVKSSSVSMTDIQEQHSSCASGEPIRDHKVSSGIDDVSRRAQELVEKINHCRTSNQKMIDSFEEKLIEKVKEVCQQMKEQMYVVYEDNSDKMQVKLQKLSEVLESCTKLNHELLEASRALGCLREDLTINQEIEPDGIIFN